jgi:hypothetical protein
VSGAGEHLTGAQLVFEGGALLLDFRQQRGHFAFTDDELEPIREHDEDGVWDGYLARLPNAELEAIRDFLNKWLPVDKPVAAPDPLVERLSGALALLVACMEDFEESDSRNQADAYYAFVKGKHARWADARALLAQTVAS